jgi:hypothetical protein
VGQNPMRNLFYISCIIFLFSCKKDPVAVPESAPPVENYMADSNKVFLNVTNLCGNSIIQMAKDTVYSSLTPKYINANGDTFSVSLFKYYLSNFRFQKSDGTWVYETNSYHLVSNADTNSYCKFLLSRVPVGYYKAVEFLIGVDSAMNCSGAQTGDLAASNDMFWSWAQGYIFLKYEGYSSSASASSYHNVEFHVGGYKLPYNNIKTVNLNFGSDSMRVGSISIPKIYLKADLQKMFTNTTSNVNFSSTSVVTSPSAARLLANNYETMFMLGGIIN